MAIVAGTSGSYKSISKIKIPKDLNIFIATDNDDQGDEYAAIICDQLPEHKLYRINLEGQ
jgi:5S rRNA maturation endonuclease (ribonuclease M5)